MQHYDEVRDTVAAIIQDKPTAHWLAALSQHGVPAAEIRGYPELLADPQFAHRNVFIDFPKAADPQQTSRLIRAGYQTDTDSPDTDLAPPLLGQHSREILLAAGYDDKQIDTWQAEGVI